MSTYKWIPADNMSLEPNAFHAATATDTNLVVTAGPGTGKTELLAQRADFLLRSGHCSYPRRILAISFKVDSARTLRERVRQRSPIDLAIRLDSYTFHSFAKRLIDSFRPVLTGLDALDADYTVGKYRIPRRQIDFDSMIPLARKILDESIVARTALRQTYEYVFLDEFQDCTAPQYDLIRTAFLGTNIEVISVGDTKQRIMGFAGALDGIFDRFANDFGAGHLSLYLNYRAEPRLQRMQNEMVRDMDPNNAISADYFTREGGEVVTRRFHDSTEEASALADQIQSWISDESIPAEEIAVLVRNQVEPYTEALQAKLRERNVPFRIENELQDLATEPVAKLIIDFLLVVTGDREPEAYTRLMRVAAPLRTDDDASDRFYAELRSWIDAVRDQYRRGEQKSLRGLVNQFRRFLGEELLHSLSPQYQQGAKLDEVVQQVFVQLRNLYSKTHDIDQVLSEFAGRGAIKLMTIHKAKGLEFDSVIVLAIEKETFWSRDTDAERSAFFVAISRAKRHLSLTTCDQRPRPAAATGRWDTARTPYEEFLSYALPSQPGSV